MSDWPEDDGDWASPPAAAGHSTVAATDDVAAAAAWGYDAPAGDDWSDADSFNEPLVADEDGYLAPASASVFDVTALAPSPFGSRAPATPFASASAADDGSRAPRSLGNAEIDEYRAAREDRAAAAVAAAYAAAMASSASGAADKGAGKSTLPRDSASALLRAHSWDVAAVMAAISTASAAAAGSSNDAAGGGLKKVLADAGVGEWGLRECNFSTYSPLLPSTLPSNADDDAGPPLTGGAAGGSCAELQTCPVCLDDLPPSLFLTPPCSPEHTACISCWLQHIFSVLSAGKNAISLRCMGHKCRYVAGDRMVRAAAAAAAIAQKRGMLMKDLCVAAPATAEQIAEAEGVIRTMAVEKHRAAAAAAAAATAASGANNENGSVSGNNVMSPVWKGLVNSSNSNRVVAMSGRASASTPSKNSTSGSKSAPSAASKAAAAAPTTEELAEATAAVLGRWDLIVPALDAMVRRHLVDEVPSLLWCPAPNCALALESAPGVRAFACGCGKELCLECGHAEPHEPADCGLVEKWEQMLEANADNARWLMFNTRLCPKCKVRIEKNSGCNHMQCTSCQYHFCWVCMAAWEDHTVKGGLGYHCNKFRQGATAAKDLVESDVAPIEGGAAATSAAEATLASSSSSVDAAATAAAAVIAGGNVGANASPEEADRARRLHQRFIFYFPRYDSHRAGQAFAERARDSGFIQARISQLLAQRPGLTALQTQWLLDGNDELILDQRALKWSYVLAYFQPEGPAKNLFEYSQQGLAEVTERLAELIEGTVVAQFKPQKVKEAVLHAKNMRMTLLKDIRSFFPEVK